MVVVAMRGSVDGLFAVFEVRAVELGRERRWKVLM
jgi:hypothetical protein